MSELDLTEAVEAAARLLADTVYYGEHDDEPDWAGASEMLRDNWRNVARRVLTTAAPLIEAQVREQVAREECVAFGSDPAWEPCAEHPGRESHCSSGWCGVCWLCRESGRDESHDLAWSEGMRSAERRIAARIARGGSS